LFSSCFSVFRLSSALTELSLGRTELLKYRYRVLIFLGVVAVITYLDRVCIAVAGPRMQHDLNFSPAAWGWVVGIFAFAYAVFEIPTGSLADNYGSRRVLTRIVLWWSFFTSLTGFASGFWALLAIRFLFGAGEAGALPNFSRTVANWFPLASRARALGIVIMTTQLGGALSPLLVIPIQARYGWRVSFYLFGVLGVLWAIIWFRWYRDNPTEMPGISQSELAELGPPAPSTHGPLSWSRALQSKNFWFYLLQGFCYYYAAFFFLSWLQTYLVKGRGFVEKQLLLSSLPFLFAAAGNFFGGFASDAFVREFGLRKGRRMAGVLGATLGAVSMTAGILISNPYASLFCLSLAYGGVGFIQPTAFALSIDIAPRHTGTVAGAMNTAAQAGGFVSSVAFGYLVKLTGSYTIPMIPMVIAFAISAFAWLQIDATKPLTHSDPV
jgi:MFS transporter, ACS family, glucarate transporter